MVNAMTSSNLNILDSSTIDDSGGVDPLVSIDNSSDPSNIMGTDPNSELVTVSETEQGLIQDNQADTGDDSAYFESNVTTGGSSVEDPITGSNLEKSLIFTDREQGSLDSSDRLYEGGYTDKYGLTGLSNNETVTLDLEAFDFGSSLQLINGGTGEIIQQSDLKPSDGSIHNQLTFTTNTDIEYVIRVTSIEDATTGKYILGTTLGELTEQLFFTDTEIGVLDSIDQTYQGRYRDEYILRGLEDQQTVILELENVGFGSSLQLVNRETGKVIHQNEVTETEGTSYSRLQFTSNNNIEYLVRVTSIGETTTGSYTLGTTFGELTPGISDQTVRGTLTESDEMTDLWSGRYTDRYEITNISPFQTIDINFNAFDYNTIVFLINADTGSHLSSKVGAYNRQQGGYTSNLTYRAKADVNYAVVVSSYQSARTGDYSLTVNTSLSVSGGFDSSDDNVHPILKTRLMDNYILSDLQVGQDVELDLNSSSNHLVQLFDQDTGTILQTTNQANLNFTVQDGINYGVRILGAAGETYDLTTNTGLLFDSNVMELNQTITSSLVTSDSRAYFKESASYQRFYEDSYYLSSDSLQGEDKVNIKINNAEFSPHLYILNAQTGEILDSRATLYSSNLSYNLDVKEGIDYLILLTSYHNAQIGKYTFTVET
ncbi:MAG: hypothetical protein QNJ37_11530 [Crocosphaera sp.]|nr:hypothetical protein [Crocosphaera sp.]